MRAGHLLIFHKDYYGGNYYNSNSGGGSSSGSSTGGNKNTPKPTPSPCSIPAVTNANLESAPTKGKYITLSGTIRDQAPNTMWKTGYGNCSKGFWDTDFEWNIASESGVLKNGRVMNITHIHQVLSVLNVLPITDGTIAERLVLTKHPFTHTPAKAHINSILLSFSRFFDTLYWKHCPQPRQLLQLVP